MLKKLSIGQRLFLFIIMCSVLPVFVIAGVAGYEINSHMEEFTEEANFEVLMELDKVIDKEKLMEIDQLKNFDFEKARSYGEKGLTQVVGKTIFAIIAVYIFIAFGYFLIYRSIAKPLKELRKTVKNASDGDLLERFEVKNHDEIGELAEDFNHMMDNISTLVREIDRTSSEAKDSSDSLVDISNQTARATNEVAITIEEIAHSSSEQARDTENGAMRVNELAGSINSVSSSIQKVDEEFKIANELNRKGLEIIDVLNQASEKSEDSRNEVRTTVMDSAEAIAQIGLIVEAISTIAEETNLLALNAAIEAARAGDSGRGFAVVADQIRKLAEDSSASTVKISNLIKEIQDKSKETVDAMEISSKIVSEQDEAIKETEKVFENISETIKGLNTEVNSIMKLNQEMNSSKDEIVGIIENISASAEQASAATEEVSASAQEQMASMEQVKNYSEKVGDISNKLDDLVKRFKVN